MSVSLPPIPPRNSSPKSKHQKQFLPLLPPTPPLYKKKEAYENDLSLLKSIAFSSEHRYKPVNDILETIDLKKINNIDKLKKANIDIHNKNEIFDYIDYLKHDVGEKYDWSKLTTSDLHKDKQRKTLKLPQIKGGIKRKKNKTVKRRKTSRRRRS